MSRWNPRVTCHVDFVQVQLFDKLSYFLTFFLKCPSIQMRVTSKSFCRCVFNIEYKLFQCDDWPAICILQAFYLFFFFDKTTLTCTYYVILFDVRIYPTSTEISIGYPMDVRADPVGCPSWTSYGCLKDILMSSPVDVQLGISMDVQKTDVFGIS
jgi:hypothetical protein